MHTASISRRWPHPAVSLLLLVGFFLLGQAAGGVAGMVAALPLLRGGPALEQIQRILGNDFTVPNAWPAMMVMQGFSSFGGFVLATWAYLKFIEGRPLASVNATRRLDLPPLLGVAVLGLAFIFLNEWIYQWNRNWDLPAWLDGFEQWSRRQQESLGRLTRFLTDFDNPARLLAGLLVIAVLPAVGEELLFRGGLQPILYRWTGRRHLAIWVTAAFFSFIHFQLDGFVPRLLLGVVFGYLYVWSGNLWYAIWAHFINNGITVLGVYLNRARQTGLDLENSEWVSWRQGVPALLACVGLLWFLHRWFSRHAAPPDGLLPETHIPPNP